MQTGGQCVFGHLKGCWCSLLTRLDLSENNIPIVTAACCVPHNICEVKGEKFQQGWGAEADGLAANFEQTDTRARRGAEQGTLFLWEALEKRVSLMS